MLKFLPRAVAGLLLAALVGAWPNVNAKQTGDENEYALSTGTVIRLSPDWASRTVAHFPPVSPLASSAPPLSFFDYQVFQNAADESQLEFGVSNNPFVGRDAYWLDTEMHRSSATGSGMVAYLFYFFFSPPRTCLDRASSDYDRAVRDATSSDKSATPDVKISLDCEYAPTLEDLYSHLISPTVTFRRENKAEHREGALRDLYVLPMDQREFNGFTFFIFEAQTRQPIGPETINHFNLPDSFQGTQADFLWAIGAPSPFPFVRDVTRKNVPLVHVVYASLAFGAQKKQDFLSILRSVRPSD
jgi:hypothetical protein